MTYRVPGDVAWTLEGGDDELATLYLARLPRGPISVLDGTGALIWLAATEGPGDTLLDRVAEEAGRPVDEVSAGVDEFLAQLVASGFLERG